MGCHLHVVCFGANSGTLPPLGHVVFLRVRLRGEVQPPDDLLDQDEEGVANLAWLWLPGRVEQPEHGDRTLRVAFEAIDSGRKVLVDDLALCVAFSRLGLGPIGCGLAARLGVHTSGVHTIEKGKAVETQFTGVRGRPSVEEHAAVWVIGVDAETEGLAVEVREGNL